MKRNKVAMKSSYLRSQRPALTIFQSRRRPSARPSSSFCWWRSGAFPAARRSQCLWWQQWRAAWPHRPGRRCRPSRSRAWKNNLKVIIYLQSFLLISLTLPGTWSCPRWGGWGAAAAAASFPSWQTWWRLEAVGVWAKRLAGCNKRGNTLFEKERSLSALLSPSIFRIAIRMGSLSSSFF